MSDLGIDIAVDESPNSGGVLALIPARAGSKGIPRKNARLFCGAPLIEWTVRAALDSKTAVRVVISTDDDEFAAIGCRAGAEAPFLRPPELSDDRAPMVDVAEHALDWFSRNDGWTPHCLLLLQPTSPLRSAEDIAGAAALLDGADSVVSLVAAKHHPAWLQRLGKDGRIQRDESGEGSDGRRQDLQPYFALNGAIYLTRCSALRKYRSFRPPKTLGYVMPVERSVDIDTELDWKIAEMLGRETLAGGSWPLK